MTECRMGDPMSWRAGLGLLAIVFLVVLAAPDAQEVMSDLPGSATTPAEREGRRVFVQRCAVCHLPLLPSPKEPYGPLLDGVFARRSAERVREAIMIGYGNMPGWRYTLTEEQVSNVVAYLRTFKN